MFVIRLMQIKKYILFGFTFLISAGLFAQYEVNNNCLNAWEALTDLRVNTARQFVADEISQNPNNYYAYYLDQMCDAYVLAINGSQDMYDQFVDNFERRREIMDDRDTESPYYLACQSEMRLHMAAFGVMYGDAFSGVRKGFKAYKRLNENVEIYPDFAANKKLDGFFNIAISNLPPFIQWAAGALGVSGDRQIGFQLLYEYFESVKNLKGLNAEAALYIILSYKLNKEPLKAFDFITTKDSSIINKRIVKYFYANTAYRSGHNDIAYKSLASFNPEEIEFDFIPYDYMMGKILLRKLDDKAAYHFKRYLYLNKKESYIKEISYKLGLTYLVNNNITQFNFYREQSCDKGDVVNERDREAVYDCELDYTPDVTLTRCKLLLEGGYHERFAEEFLAYHFNISSPLPYQLEYYLLKARHEEFLGNKRLAEESYKTVINSGRYEDYYFASEAAMRLGLMMIDSNREKAIKYLELARDLYDSDYYEYIDEIAKRELNILDD
jgi:hypothetical protein